MVLLGLLINFPLFVRAGSPPSSSGGRGNAWSQTTLNLCTEIVLLGPLIIADWNRRRLLAECERQIDQARTQTRRDSARPAAMRFLVAAGRAGGADAL
jgi:hypothetical protein